MTSTLTLSLSTLLQKTGLDVLDHLEQDAAIPVISGLQAQGDLLIIPADLVPAVTVRPWAVMTVVPAAGVEVLRGAAGGNPHTLVAGPGACRWTTSIVDPENLALGWLESTQPAYLVHPEHGGAGLAPGCYVIRRQRERGRSADHDEAAWGGSRGRPAHLDRLVED